VTHTFLLYHVLTSHEQRHVLFFKTPKLPPQNMSMIHVIGKKFKPLHGYT